MIETARLHLRDLTWADYDDMLRVFSSFQDPGLFPDFAEHIRGWLHYYITHRQQRGYGMYAVVLRASDQLIGDCGLEYYADIDGRPEVEIAYEFDRAAWSNGYATEAAAAVRDHAFGALGLNRIVSFISENHTASRRVVEKIGMVVEKTVVKDGQPLPCYALNREAPEEGDLHELHSSVPG